MRIGESIARIREEVAGWSGRGLSTGLVPTMGALHEGHMSLIRASKGETDRTVVSIFVNPTQFGPQEDFSSYPRTFERDRELCEMAGVDLIFAPNAREMYPLEQISWISLDQMGDFLCGGARPGFFRGVCTVVAKLFNIVQPDRAYFGEKDAQQLAIITRMVKDLNFPVEIRPCPTVREADGLAMSSRNRYLDKLLRQQSLCLYESLQLARELIGKGERDSEKIIAAMRNHITGYSEARVDYISIVDKELLQPIPTIEQRALIALAVFVGPARLIDNITIDLPAQKS